MQINIGAIAPSVYRKHTAKHSNCIEQTRKSDGLEFDSPPSSASKRSASCFAVVRGASSIAAWQLSAFHIRFTKTPLVHAHSSLAVVERLQGD